MAEIAKKLLPTPMANEHKKPNAVLTETGRRRCKNGSHSLGLADTARLLPTPTVSGNHNRKGASATSGDGLATVARLFPTPTTGAGLCGGTGNFQQLRHLQEDGAITEEERRSMSQGNGGSLNPEFVGRMMGYPPDWTDSGTATGRAASPP
jgi:hypothetical protein